MTEISFEQLSKIRICKAGESQTIEIGRKVIETGFLQKFPGSTLPILLYLLSIVDENGYLRTNPVTIASFLPCNPEEIKEGLSTLAEQEIIHINSERDGDYTYLIKINLQALDFNPQDTNEITGQKTRNISSQELISTLKAYTPSGVNTNIEEWIDDFEPELIKELLRRVDKWFVNQHQQSPEKRFYYLMGILDDWYEKKIFSYEKLRHYDRLYRETRELASTYGLNKWQNINPALMETFKSWISGENGLGLSVAKLAIKEAVKRKKDGQPSLKYIEDNFINPWKETGIQNIQQAKQLLKSQENKPRQSKTDSPSRQDSPSGESYHKNYDWEYFPWDIGNLRDRKQEV